jgi:DNA-binding MarR family transcriptional regulator
MIPAAASPAAETGRTAATAATTRDTAATATAIGLGDAVGRLARVIRRAHVAPMGATSTSALVTVIRCGPIRLGDLAEREGVAPATLSRVVVALERDGYVERTIDRADRRSAFLVSTQLGRDVVDGLRLRRAEVLSERISRLGDLDRARLADAIDVLSQLADDDTAQSRPGQPNAGGTAIPTG